ncbi:MAG TPA: hypothetical protein VII08_00705 [Myxococcales bacterium]
MGARRPFCFLAAAIALAAVALAARAQVTSPNTSRADRATAAPPSAASGTLPVAPRIVMFSGTGIVVFSGPADVGDLTPGLKVDAAPRSDAGRQVNAGAEVGPGPQIGGTESDAGTW